MHCPICRHGFISVKQISLETKLKSNILCIYVTGQISVQRAILTVKNYEKLYSASVDAFIEDALVRRELSDNFCFYNKNYDSLNGLTDWAKKTLNGHK